MLMSTHRLDLIYSNCRRWLAPLLLLVLCQPAWAWWQPEWAQRTEVTIDTSEVGVATGAAVSSVPLAVRLHSGNFDFVGAKIDGSDLRVVAGDDQTPLPFSIERFDSVNELAVLWVQVPSVLPGTDKNIVYVYAGNPAAAALPQASAPAGGGVEGFDAATLAAFHFSDANAASHDGRLQAADAFVPEPAGLLAGAVKLEGRGISWPATEALRVDANGAVTVSLWLRPEANANALVWSWGALQLSLQGTQLRARVAGSGQPVLLEGGNVPAASWSHLSFTLGQGRARLLVDGEVVAQADAATPALQGPFLLAPGGADSTNATSGLTTLTGLKGLADELQVSATVRGDDWLRLAVAAQGIEGKLLRSSKQTPDSISEEGDDQGQRGYIGILVQNLSVDAWVVIVILAVMFAIAMWVMAERALRVSRADNANQDFLRRFRDADDDLLQLEDDARHGVSPLYRLYQAGRMQLTKRRVDQPDAKPLSAASLNAVKAAIDADQVRETTKLNTGMVLLTIAIAGGPFLGLLGTVIGVMITFAAIAAAGDVNVNAIAPGIAAALLTTVAGLAVAIPALFGYNYLASRIKNVSNDMQIFVDEFVTRVAERYGQP